MKFSLLPLLVSALTWSRVNAIDMPELKSKLIVPDESSSIRVVSSVDRLGDDTSSPPGRFLSEFTTGGCLTDLLELDFAQSTLLPGTLSDTTPLVFEGVAPGLDLWISIDPTNTYLPANPALNGFACAEPQVGDTGAPTNGCTSAPMVQLNLKQGEVTQFVFTLYETGTSTPATIPSGKGIRFSVFDIDRGSAAGVETYTVDDWVTAVFIDDAPEEATFGVSTAPFNSLTAAATSVGRGCDNPIDPFNLEDISCDAGIIDVKKRSFMVEFVDTNTWKMLFSVSGSGNGGRNLLMSFCSELQDYCPNSDGRGAACGGDPHFQRWGVSERDSFHGECDLVLIKNKNLDVHVRTSIIDAWSYIESAAVRIGTHIFEFTKDNDLIIDGVETALDEDKPFVFDGSCSITKIKSFYLLQEVGGRFVLKVKRTGMFHTISMDGVSSYLSQSRGLLGSYPLGKMIGRDGGLLKTFDALAFDWQVTPDDPKLFVFSREPQLPYERCRVPSETQLVQRRNLRGENKALYEEAVSLCTVSNTLPKNIQLCIDDVMATGDVNLAQVW